MRTPTLEWAAAGPTTLEKASKLSSNRPWPARTSPKIGEGLLMVRINRQGLAEQPLGFGEVLPLVVVVSQVAQQIGVLGIGLQCFVVLGQRPGTVALSVVQHGQVVRNGLQAWIVVSRLFVEQNGLLRVSVAFAVPRRPPSTLARPPWEAIRRKRSSANPILRQTFSITQLNFEGTRLEVAQPRHEDRQSKPAQKTDFARTVGNIVTTLRRSDYLAVGQSIPLLPVCDNVPLRELEQLLSYATHTPSPADPTPPPVRRCLPAFRPMSRLPPKRAASLARLVRRFEC